MLNILDPKSAKSTKLADFKFNLPKNLIAKYPVDPRSSSRMLVLNRKTGELEDKKFVDILNFFQKGDCIVLNETKVFPAKICGKKEKTNAKIDVILLRELKPEKSRETDILKKIRHEYEEDEVIDNKHIWDVLVEPARKVRIGNKIFFDQGKVYCEIIDNTTSRGRSVRFSYDGDFYRIIDRIGNMPLPEYIKRDPLEFDKNSYQTIFANPECTASIAPPGAGLHFSEEIIEELKKKGVRIAKVVLHIGQGIFDKIDVEDLTRHRMYSECFEISKDAAEIINKALNAKKNVYAVGASVARVLESSVLTTGKVKPNRGWTDKFIYPPYDFKIVNKLITNFHQPSSPSLLLAAAFAGRDQLLKAYKKAIKEEYRFLVYGDAMLII